MIPASGAVSLLAAAAYNSPKPSSNTGWDTLYIAVTMIFILMVVTGLATWFNRRDDRQM